MDALHEKVPGTWADWEMFGLAEKEGGAVWSENEWEGMKELWMQALASGVHVWVGVREE